MGGFVLRDVFNSVTPISGRYFTSYWVPYSVRDSRCSGGVSDRWEISNKYIRRGRVRKMYCYEIFIFRCGEKRFAGSADSNSITEFFSIIIVELKAIITIGTHNGVWWWNTINRIEITKQIFERSPLKTWKTVYKKLMIIHRTQLSLRFKKQIHT